MTATELRKLETTTFPYLNKDDNRLYVLYDIQCHVNILHGTQSSVYCLPDGITNDVFQSAVIIVCGIIFWNP